MPAGRLMLTSILSSGEIGIDLPSNVATYPGQNRSRKINRAPLTLLT